MISEKKDALYYYKKIEPLKKEGLWWQVVEVYKKVISLTYQPKRELLLEYIFSLKKMYRFKEVINVYKQVEAIAPLTSDESFDYAYALERNNQKELAELFYAKAIELDNKKNAKLFGKGVFFEALGDWSSASKAYEESFKEKKLSIQMAYKQGLAYDRCYSWAKAEETYLNAILGSDEPIHFYHRLGIVQERQKKYDKAIESYLVAVFKHKQHLPYFYYRLGYLLRKKELYKEACEAFLMMKKKPLLLNRVKNKSVEKENGVLLHKYLLENEPLSLNAWLEFAKKAESLKSWRVAEYAYKEYLARAEEFNADIYFLLASTLVQQERYKEASELFLEQRIIQDAHGLVESEYHKNSVLQQSINYVEYYERLELDERLIVYEGYQDSFGKSVVLDLFKEIQKDVHFDPYRHIWVINRIEEIPKEVKENRNVILINKDSNLYRRYLCSSKYIINNTKLPDYFIQKEGQFCLNEFTKETNDPLKRVEEIFFQQRYYKEEKSKKKSILLYGGHFIPNGITTSFLNLVNAIDKDRYRVYVVVDEEQLSRDEQYKEQFKRLNSDITLIKKKSTMLMSLEEKWLIGKLNLHHDLASKEMWSIVKRAYRREYQRVFQGEKFDLIVNFEGYSQYWLRLFASVEEVPKVLYFHSDILSEAKTRFPYLYGNMKFYKSYTKLISVSKDSCQINQKNLGLDRELFDYCNNILNPKEIIEKSKAPISDEYEKDIFKNSRVFINIARLSPEKGQRKLIYAFSKLTKEYSDIKLVILGQGPLEEDLKELIVELSLEDRVFLLGQKFNPMPYLKASDCFVLSSNHEGQGLVLFEAMILNKPIISTNIEGPRGVLKNNLGYLVENSKNGLYEGMSKFLTSSLNLNRFNAEDYNKEALEMFEHKVLSLSHNFKYSLDSLYQAAIEHFNKKEYRDALEKFQEVKEKYPITDNRYPTLYYIRESKIRYALEVEKKEITEIVSYVKHRFNAESFTGILILLEKLKDKSKEWNNFYLAFVELIEYVKTDDSNMRESTNELFLAKIEEFSKSFSRKLEAEYLPHTVWFIVANLFLLVQKYTLYYYARENALKSILSLTRTINVKYAQYRLTAMAESQSIEEYDRLKNVLLKKELSYIKKNLQLIGATELYFGRKESAIEFYKQILTPLEQKFASYIENKSVAIVGPVDSGLNLGDEIDSYDIVLRFNYMGRDKLSQNSFGKKTNISFYIEARLLRDRIESKKVNWLNELDWVIVDSPHSLDDIAFTGVTKPIRKRYYAAHPFANPMLKGAPSGIQRVILDLMRFNVKKIKVFNTNLFLENNYDKNYVSRGKLGVKYFNFHWHDPLSNFLFLKRLHSFSLIEVDEILNNILKMSKEEYAKALELRYGDKNKD